MQQEADVIDPRIPAVYPEFLPLWQEMQEAIASIQAQQHGLEHPPRVSFVGRFKTGKSRLINALVGADVLPSDLDECTAHLVELAHDTQKRVVRLTGDDLRTAAEERITVKQFQQAVDLTKASDKKFLAENVGFRYYVNSPLLQAIRIVDTPGFDGTNADQRERGKWARERAIRQSDLCVLVLSAGLGTDDLECARLIQQHSVEMVVVLNKSDQYDRDDRQEMQEAIITDLKREVGVSPSFYACSALWQNGSHEDQDNLTRQRCFFDKENVAQWHQWEALTRRLARPLKGERYLALLSTVRRAFNLAMRVNEQYDVNRQADATFLNSLPRWKEMMPSLVGQAVLQIAVSAAQSHRPLPWKRLENFGITPETVAPKRPIPRPELEQLLDCYFEAIRAITAIATDTQSVQLYNAVLADDTLLAAFVHDEFGIHLREYPGHENCIQDAHWFSQPFRADFSYREALRGLQARWNAAPGVMTDDCARLRNRLAAALA